MFKSNKFASKCLLLDYFNRKQSTCISVCSYGQFHVTIKLLFTVKSLIFPQTIMQNKFCSEIFNPHEIGLQFLIVVSIKWVNVSSYFHERNVLIIWQNYVMVAIWFRFYHFNTFLSLFDISFHSGKFFIWQTMNNFNQIKKKGK